MKVKILPILIAFAFISAQAKEPKKITLENIWLERTFSPNYVDGLESMNDGTHYSVLDNVEGKQQINKYSYQKGSLVQTILKNNLKTSEGKDLNIESYKFSKNENLILMRTESERIYRHSMRSAYYVYNLTSKELKRIGNGKFQLATFSPDGKFISFVRENNLYLFDIAGNAEIAVTTDGKKNSIINGAPDWVYEEEFTLVRAYEWSDDSKCLAFYRFDESNVKEFSFPMYGTLYPENYVYKYPKAGEENSRVKIKIYHLEDKKTVSISHSANFEYIPRIKWIPTNTMLSIQTMNRLQNELFVEFADRHTGEARSVLFEQSSTYLEVQDITFLNNTPALIWQSERTGSNHLYLMEFGENMSGGADDAVTQQIPITEGREIVTQLIGVNEEDQTVCYEFADQYNSKDRFVRIIQIKRIEGIEIEPIDMELKSGISELEPSKNLSYYIAHNSSANSVPVVMVLDKRGDIVRTIEDNKDLKETLDSYELGKKEFFQFKNKEGIQLDGWMIKPANFDPSKKYPLLMYVYGGPGSQTVTNSWGGSNDMWYQYLAQNGYIVASVDNRGTGGSTRDFRACTYGQLGKLESEDQIDAAKHLGEMPFIDVQRIGIWGWSYGGYMSTLCLAKGADVFKTAIAVAPVTNWRYYDSIYTERYMSLPSDNAKGYDENSPINHVDKIKGNYLLVHGTADDNVHFQNTTELINALVREDVQFDLAIYPNKNHGIYGGNTRYHLYTKMSNFIFENL